MSYLENDEQGNLASDSFSNYINPATVAHNEGNSGDNDSGFKVEPTRFPTPSSSNEHLVDFDSGNTADVNINYNFLPTPESSPYEASFNLDLHSVPMSHNASSAMSMDIPQGYGESLGMYYPTPSSSSMGSANGNSLQMQMEQELSRLLRESGASAHVEQGHEEERQRIAQAHQIQQQQQQQHHQRMMYERMQRVSLNQAHSQSQQSQPPSRSQSQQSHANAPVHHHHPYRIAGQSTRSVRRKQSAPAVRSIQAPAPTMSIQPSATVSNPQPSSSNLGRIDETKPEVQHNSSCHRNVRTTKNKRMPRKAVSMPAIRQVAEVQEEERREPKVTKSPGGISFINFGQEHADTLIAGVAPSGSNKRKKKAQANAN